jgi:hypothetical protein
LNRKIGNCPPGDSDKQIPWKRLKQLCSKTVNASHLGQLSSKSSRTIGLGQGILIEVEFLHFHRRDAECTEIDFIGFSLSPLSLCGETKRRILSRTGMIPIISAEGIVPTVLDAQ